MFKPPREHEAHLFNEIYIDETSQTDHRFLVLGGIMIPLAYSSLFEQAIIDARSHRLRRITSEGNYTELGWKHVSKRDFEEYKRIVDVFFGFRGRTTSIHDDVKFFCSVVDTHVKGRRYSGGLKGEIGFNREIYYHCLHIASEHETRLFYVYPDKRSTIEPMRNLQVIINRGISKRGDTRDWPFRRLAFRTSIDVQALQMSDIMIGALAYRLNRHYDKPDANADKKQLADYIMRKANYLAQINSGLLKRKNWGNFQIWVRRHRG